MIQEYCVPVKVFGLKHLHENTHIKFNDEGIILSVGLNVEEKISRLLNFNQAVTGFKGKVYKADKMFVYRHYYSIKSKHVNAQTIQFMQDDLLKKVQTDINIAKSTYYMSLAQKTQK